MTITMPALDEVEGKIKHRRDELGTIFEEAGPDLDFTKVKSVAGDTRDVVAHVRKLNDELTDLSVERDNLKAARNAAERLREPDDAGVEGPTTKAASRGEWAKALVDSEAFRTKGQTSEVEVDLKAVLSTGAGWAPEDIRTGRVVESAQRPIQVADIIPTTTTARGSVTYMEETTFTNNAAETAEGAAYGEAGLVLEEKTSPVRKIAVFLPITDEQLEDVEQARGYVSNRLGFMVRQRLDAQILTGDGTAPNLRGLLSVVGVQTQAKGTDPTPDAVYKGLVKVNTVGQAMADTAVFNPLDWQDVRLLRTADGLYIWGNPSDAGPLRIWGLRVVEAQALTENTAVVGDFGNFSELAVRRGLQVKVSDSHADYFASGKQAMRVDVRAAVTFYRPAAFCTVTGI